MIPRRLTGGAVGWVADVLVLVLCAALVVAVVGIVVAETIRAAGRAKVARAQAVHREGVIASTPHRPIAGVAARPAVRPIAINTP